MVEIHCTASHCDWTTDDTDVQVLARRALSHHNDKGLEPTSSGLAHRHVYFDDRSSDTVIICQTAK